jgi:hypothetical protein
LENTNKKAGVIVGRHLCILLLCQSIMFYSQLCGAEDYAECRARCAQDYTDCMNQPQDSDTQVQFAKEAACTQKVQDCYADCENLKPLNEDIAPESNPNVIRK